MCCPGDVIKRRLCGLGAFAHGNIPGHTDPDLFFLKPLGRPHDMNNTAIFAQVAVLMVGGGDAGVDAFDQRPAGSAIVGVHHLKGRAANHFVRSITENPFTGGADRQKTTLYINHTDDVEQ